jgi:hypothetical protein
LHVDVNILVGSVSRMEETPELWWGNRWETITLINEVNAKIDAKELGLGNMNYIEMSQDESVRRYLYCLRWLYCL